MSEKGLQNKLFIALFVLLLGTATYASEPIQELETINLSKEFLQNEPQPSFQRTNKMKLGAFKTQRKQLKQKNMSKKFGPLLISFTVRSLNRTAVGFNIDVLEALDIIAARDASLFLRTDNKHFILSPQTRDEVKRTIHMFKAKFKGADKISQETTSAQLI